MSRLCPSGDASHGERLRNDPATWARSRGSERVQTERGCGGVLVISKIMYEVIKKGN